MPNIFFNSLTEFNAALFYAFEPETDFRIDMDAEVVDHVQYLTSYISQQRDMYEALIYAQDELLPQVHAGFDDLSAEQLLVWIKKIHEKAGKTVLGFNEEPSGVYGTMGILRWEQGMDIMLPIRAFLSHQFKDVSCEMFCEMMMHQQPTMDLHAFKAFMNLLVRIGNDDSIQPSEAFLGEREGPNKQGIETLAKLQWAYHTPDLLTAEEKQCIRKFVKICILPEQRESAMRAYAEDVVVRLRACDTKDKQTVSDTLAEIFYGLVEVHPFLNCNGRTATILMNVLLRAMGQPSILLRYPGERDDETSAYSRAFKNIDTTRAPLADLIKTRMESEPYQEALSHEVTILKSCFLDELVCIGRDFGQEKAQHMMRVAMQSFSKNLDRTRPAKEIEKNFAEHALAVVKILGPQLKLERIKQDIPSTTRFLEQAFEAILGECCVWRFYQKGTIAFLELDNTTRQTSLAKCLRATEAMTVTATKRADTQAPVIKLETFHFEKLLQLVDKHVSERALNEATSSLTL